MENGSFCYYHYRCASPKTVCNASVGVRSCRQAGRSSIDSQTIQFENGRKHDDLTGERKAALDLLKGVNTIIHCV